MEGVVWRASAPSVSRRCASAALWRPPQRGKWRVASRWWGSSWVAWGAWLLPRRRYGACFEVGWSWTALALGWGLRCREAGGRGGRWHCLGELISVSDCRTDWSWWTSSIVSAAIMWIHWVRRRRSSGWPWQWRCCPFSPAPVCVLEVVVLSASCRCRFSVLSDLSNGSCASFCCDGCNGVNPKLSHILIRNMCGPSLCPRDSLWSWERRAVYIINCPRPKRLFLLILHMLPLALQFWSYNPNGVPCPSMTDILCSMRPDKTICLVIK
jgi:hypothetical protein